jgi:hypothetical protein
MLTPGLQASSSRIACWSGNLATLDAGRHNLALSVVSRTQDSMEESVDR